MTAPVPDVAARIAAIEAAEDAPEALRERVARAMYETNAAAESYADAAKDLRKLLADAAPDTEKETGK